MKICTASGIVSRDLARALDLDLEHAPAGRPRGAPLELGAQRAVAAAGVARVLDELARLDAPLELARRRGSGSRRRRASPGRGARVVAETDSSSSGTRSRSVRISVPLPTPEGPVMTKTRGTRADAAASGAACETSSVRWRCERPPIVLLGEMRHWTQHLVDLHAAVLRDREQHVEDLGGLDVLRRLEQEVVDATCGRP